MTEDEEPPIFGEIVNFNVSWSEVNEAEGFPEDQPDPRDHAGGSIIVAVEDIDALSPAAREVWDEVIAALQSLPGLLHNADARTGLIGSGVDEAMHLLVHGFADGRMAVTSYKMDQAWEAVNWERSERKADPTTVTGDDALSFFRKLSHLIRANAHDDAHNMVLMFCTGILYERSRINKGLLEEDRQEEADGTSPGS